MTKKNFISYTGIWLYPIGCAFCWLVLNALSDMVSIPRDVYLAVMFAAPAIFPAVITFTNIQKQQQKCTYNYKPV